MYKSACRRIYKGTCGVWELKLEVLENTNEDGIVHRFGYLKNKNTYIVSLDLSKFGPACNDFSAHGQLLKGEYCLVSLLSLNAEGEKDFHGNLIPK